MSSSFSTLPRLLFLSRTLRFSTTRTFSVRTITAEQLENPKKKPHPEAEVFPGEYGDRPLGKVFDKKPFRIHLEAGKKYAWCTCGQGHTQPMCDGWHKELDGTHVIKAVPKFRPIRFTVKESKEYWLCNCKQTSNAPFCDGTHRREDIQAAKVMAG